MRHDRKSSVGDFFFLSAAFAAFASTGCSGEPGADAPAEVVGDTSTGVTFEEFEKTVHKDPKGVYVVDGDTPVENIKKLRELFDEIASSNKLIVQRSGSRDVVWNNTQKLNISYCVSEDFGSRKATVVKAMEDATGAWMAAAGVRFVHVAAEDRNCDETNGRVVFDVSPVSGQPFLARAFFPSQGRATRNVLVDSSSFTPGAGVSLTGILRHELGHSLGWRHEHTRSEAKATRCFEDQNWRALTPYDRRSVMHYPQCNGVSTGLVLTDYDREGARSVYGAPGADPTPGPTPTPSPTPKSFSGTLARGEQKAYGPYAVKEGFKAVLEGTGDADLYVRFGAAPTANSYACRPYLQSSNETCDLDVPAGQTRAYVLVSGYTASSYTLTVTY